MNQQTILFVDDEANILSALRRLLRKEPYRILFANGPEEAFSILAQEEVDLVVSDHLMPGMDGLELLDKVKELKPQIVRVILTGHADLQMAIQAINQGEVFRFLTKPWNDLELKFTLKHIMDYIELRKENQMLQRQVHEQQVFIDQMEEEHPGIFTVERDASGAIVLDLDAFELDHPRVT